MSRTTTIDAMLREDARQKAKELREAAVLKRELQAVRALAVEFDRRHIGYEELESFCAGRHRERRWRLVYVVLGNMLSTEAQIKWVRHLCRGTRDEYDI